MIFTMPLSSFVRADRFMSSMSYIYDVITRFSIYRIQFPSHSVYLNQITFLGLSGQLKNYLNTIALKCSKTCSTIS